MSSLKRTGSTWQWRKIRARIIARDGACTICGSTQRLEVDHIMQRKHGGPDDDWALRTLCHNCHKEVTRRQNTKRILRRKQITASPLSVISPRGSIEPESGSGSLWKLERDSE